MTRKIAVINDLSGFGRCSLTAAIPVISVMGAQPCPLPTAILSGQTGYSSFYCDDYTEKMEYFRQEWEKMGAAFDGIYTGYVANERQITQIFRFLDTFYAEDPSGREKAVKNSSEQGKAIKGSSIRETKQEKEPEGSRPFLLVDPVMGDEGRVYKMFTPKLLEQMKCLAARADVITPNLTELCLLTGNEYREVKDMADEARFLNAIERMAREMISRGPHIVVVTGICLGNPAEGASGIGNLAVKAEGASGIGNPAVKAEGTSGIGNPAAAGEAVKSKLSVFPYVGGSFSGTGDLFASVLAGGMARGDDIFQIVELAGEFIARAMGDTVKEGVGRNDGTNFEKYLGMLIRT